LASDPPAVTIAIPVLLWARVIFQLRRRGAGKRESGAFLLGSQRGESARVTAYICYDDLDQNAYESGGIAFHAEGYAALWSYCRETKLQLLADVHTHPAKGIRQSPIDQRNPMVPIVGHIAIIVPNLARTSWWSLRMMGIYEYLGNFRWRTHNPSGGQRCIVLTLW
jgi:proteasome lid subunit RPN8/RPN11